MSRWISYFVEGLVQRIFLCFGLALAEKRRKVRAILAGEASVAEWLSDVKTAARWYGLLAAGTV
jgi:hypothetical protein